jgi:predicted Rossmann fold nucleotide-binding protein DprA/Smf involved in DNA uptake
MMVAIVGSIRYTDKKKVEQVVDAIGKKHTILSGGCRGVDTWAVNRAKENGIATKVIEPEMYTAKNFYQIVDAYYERNKKIAETCDCMIAFVAKDRKGGTENAIKYALKANKQVFIYE